MATNMDTDDNTLFDCSICMEDMMQRNPRLLQCHHTFCEKCLAHMIHARGIQCPTCRQVTPVNAGDVTMLPINFMLIQFKEREEKMRSLPHDVMCGLCSQDTSRYRCRECAISMCHSCSEKHSNMDHFREHQLFQCCPTHSDGLATHICKTCIQPVCTKCIMFQHTDHEKEIVKFDDGVEELLTDNKVMISNLDKVAALIRENRATDIAEMEKMDKIQKEIGERRAFHLSKFEEAEKILKEMRQNNTKDRYKLLQNYSKAIDESGGIKTSLTEEIQKVQKGDISSYLNSKHNVDKFIQNTRGLTKPSFRPLPFVLSEPGSDAMVTKIHVPLDVTPDPEQSTDMPHLKKVSKWLKEPELVKNIDIYTAIGSKYPEQVQCAGTRAALLADRRLESIPMIDKDGSLLGQIPIPLEYGKITGLSVFGDTLFVALQRCVTEHAFSDIKRTAKSYVPNIKSIYGLLAITQTILGISDYYAGSLYEYRTESNITKEVVTGLKRPSYISKNEAGSMYVVTIEGDEKLNIYNKDWQIMKTISSSRGQLNHPKATVVVLNCLLVADRDNHRISQYSLDGTFQNHLLHDKHGISFPVGLAYNTEHILVLERNNPSHYRLKYFRLFE